MDENPYQSPRTEGESQTFSPEAIRTVDREFLLGLGVNVTMGIFASLILDGGWIARHYLPFCLAHVAASWLMYRRARRCGMKWTAVDLYFLRMGPPIGFLIAAIIAVQRY